RIASAMRSGPWYGAGPSGYHAPNGGHKRPDHDQRAGGAQHYRDLMAGVAPLPDQPGPVRRLVAGVGRTLIAIGLLILLFVAYELWGTGFAEARSQRALRHQFQGAAPTSPAQRTEPTTVGPPTTLDPASAPP